MNIEITQEQKDKAEKIAAGLSAVLGWGNICSNCVHGGVCKYQEETHEKCEYYKYRANYKRYGDISEFFYPIFEWLQFHYPARGVSFIVEHDKAQMMLEHGVSAFSKRITQYCCCSGTTAPEKTDADGGQ